MICLFDPHSRSKGLAAVRGWKLEKKKMKMMDVVGIRVLSFKPIFVMKKTMEEEKREISCAATRSTSMMVPCGYRFHPRDEELLVYLKRKIHNLPLPCDIIKEVELYKYDPSELTGLF